MNLIDILIILVIVSIAIYSFKKVKASIKTGKCAGCSHACECKKKKETLEKGYKEWMKNKND